MNQDWSEDEDNNEEELIQPDREFPISDEEEEDDEYNMYELSQLTIKTDNTFDLFNKKDDNNKIINNKKKENNNKKIFSDLFIKKNNINEKRRFNPRLPPPNKYN